MTLKSIFKNPEEYNFFLSPTIIRKKGGLSLVPLSRKPDMASWKKSQKRFLKWYTNPLTLDRKTVELHKTINEKIIEEFGLLNGNVLDIGGGWGLFRQWWTAKENNIYIVHDPAFSQFILGPRSYYFDIYEEGFSKPMTFVEGYGEQLPYRPASFHTAILSETLDHCLNPDRVLKEVFRCLRNKGKLLIVNHIEQANLEEVKKPQSLFYKPKKGMITKKLKSVMKHPAASILKLEDKLFGDHHLRILSPEIIKNIAIDSGFRFGDDFHFKDRNPYIYALIVIKVADS